MPIFYLPPLWVGENGIASPGSFTPSPAIGLRTGRFAQSRWVSFWLIFSRSGFAAMLARFSSRSLTLRWAPISASTAFASFHLLAAMRLPWNITAISIPAIILLSRILNWVTSDKTTSPISSSRRSSANSGPASKQPCPHYCRECEVLFACNGGCPKDRFSLTPDGKPGLNYLCAGYKRFFQHVDQSMRKMAELLRNGRPPAEIMNLYAIEDIKWKALAAGIGRNQACPCGSGKKAKHCHAA